MTILSPNTKQKQADIDSDKFFQFVSPAKHTWCSGCGNYGILNALSRALSQKNLAPHQLCLAYDIGCSGNASDKIMTYTIHGLHGRVLPLAAGMSLARPDMPIIASAGDGATLSEGINHFIHAIRNNYNITFILHNNKNYGLTTGQASSTTPKGQMMNGTPGLTIQDDLNPLALALASGAGFVARGYTGEVEQLSSLISQGIDYPGFALIEVLQLCPTYNHATPQAWYDERVYDVSTLPDYDNTDIWQAKKLVEDYESSRISTGLLYHKSRLDFYSSLEYRQNLDSTPVQEVDYVDISGLSSHFL